MAANTGCEPAMRGDAREARTSASPARQTTETLEATSFWLLELRSNTWCPKIPIRCFDRSCFLLSPASQAALPEHCLHTLPRDLPKAFRDFPMASKRNPKLSQSLPRPRRSFQHPPEPLQQFLKSSHPPPRAAGRLALPATPRFIFGWGQHVYWSELVSEESVFHGFRASSRRDC